MDSGRKLRILTFLRHEAYMYELAKTGHEFHLLLVDRTLWQEGWDSQSRPMPPNVRVVDAAEDVACLDLDQYDLLLAQTYDDFEIIEKFPHRKMILLHTAAALLGPDGLSRAQALRRLYQEWQLASIPVTYVSHYVARNWRLPGRVILHSLDIRDYEGFPHTGKIAAVLTVAHFFKEREELGQVLHRQVVGDGIPCKIVGHNPALPDCKAAKDWDELKGYYGDYRVYLNTTSWGGSLAMIEAMVAGMPVVTTPGAPADTPQKSVIDGFNGFVSDDPQYLREKIKFLLANPDVAIVMGQRAKETVRAKHSIERFVQGWDEAFHNAISERISRQIGNLPSAFYEGAGVVSDPKASFGKALFSPAELPGEHILYGPFIHLPSGEYQIAFYLRPGEGGDFARWAASAARRQLAKIDARWAAHNPELAVVDVCSGAEAKLHARQAIHLSDFRPRGSYQAFRLSFHSSAEKLFQFRVFATGAIPLQVDPYATWVSLRRVVS